MKYRVRIPVCVREDGLPVTAAGRTISLELDVQAETARDAVKLVGAALTLLVERQLPDWLRPYLLAGGRVEEPLVSSGHE